MVARSMVATRRRLQVESPMGTMPFIGCGSGWSSGAFSLFRSPCPLVPLEPWSMYRGKIL